MVVRQPTKEDTALSLTLAVVASANSPLLLLDGDLNVVAVSASFCRAFGIGADSAQGQQVFALGRGEWDIPQLRALLEATLAGDEPMDAEVNVQPQSEEPRQLLVHAERLAYLDLDQIRVLAAVSDVTDARAANRQAEDLRQRNAMLVQEARHRVANSLQIIASVLMQHARKSQSEETRSHLQSAHHRVMSVAALEHHLAGSGEDHVRVRPYLVKLCESIRASMIQDPQRVSLQVVGDDATVDANVSVSLGLITTELVINAVKHAFPEGRSGTITVSYVTEDGGWALTIKDDGVGLPAETAAVSGLGTSIVQALAMQLRALVVVDRERAGTAVSVVHPAPTQADLPG